jgi:hypothetical protein
MFPFGKLNASPLQKKEIFSVSAGTGGTTGIGTLDSLIYFVDGQKDDHIFASNTSNAVNANKNYILTTTIPAGTWDINGRVFLNAGGATNITQLLAGIFVVPSDRNLVTTPLTGAELAVSYLMTQEQYVAAGIVVSNGWIKTLDVPATRFFLKAPTTIGLYTQCSFSVSTLTALGMLWARRVR